MDTAEDSMLEEDEILITFAVGWIFADGWMYTSPAIVALVIPLPQAKSWGDVILNSARYKDEHFKDIL